MAVNIDPFDLASGDDIRVGSFIVKQPTLYDIRKVGKQTYTFYLNMISISKERLLEAISISNYDNFNEWSVYDIIGNIQEIRDTYIEAISFFIPQEIEWDGSSFVINSVPCDASQLDILKDVINQISFVATERSEERKFAGNKAKEIFEKLQKGRSAMRRSKQEDANMDLGNIICAVAAKHSSYNLLNIWGLTIYQLYDQFSRLNTNVQLDIYSQRWAAWGQDDFDTSTWFKTISRKE